MIKTCQHQRLPVARKAAVTTPSFVAQGDDRVDLPAAGRRAWRGKHFACGLFIAKSNHWVHFHGAARRNVAGGEGHEHEQHDNGDKRQRVFVVHAV